MAFAKKELFESQLQETAEFFKAFAHPARLQIIRYISKAQTCISGDISEELPLSRTTVNQHLAGLKKVGLIIGQVSGAKTNYCLNPAIVKKMKVIIDDFLENVECCDDKKC